MKQITIIGDVHGKINEYHKIISNCEQSICVGDFGFRKEWEWLDNNKISINHKINMGNHDYIPVVNRHLNSFGNHFYSPIFNLFTVRGADSIDKHLRIESKDWFANEELNYQEQLDAFDKYIECKPRIVISHDCPQSVMTSLFGYPEKSQTRIMLEHMYNEHKPELWIFGHHHKSVNTNILGTNFICLNELETYVIPI